MRKKLAEQFSREVEGYRRGLLFCAKKNDWEEFKAKAGKLFDYVEAVERVELEKRFFMLFSLILAALVLAVVALLNVNFEVSAESMRLKNTVMFTAIVASTFELYFFVNYRTYAGARISFYKERRENFIKNIEKDFRNFDLQTGVRN